MTGRSTVRVEQLPGGLPFWIVEGSCNSVEVPVNVASTCLSAVDGLTSVLVADSASRAKSNLVDFRFAVVWVARDPEIRCSVKGRKLRTLLVSEFVVELPRVSTGFHSECGKPRYAFCETKLFCPSPDHICGMANLLILHNIDIILANSAHMKVIIMSTSGLITEFSVQGIWHMYLIWFCGALEFA